MRLRGRAASLEPAHSVKLHRWSTCAGAHRHAAWQGAAGQGWQCGQDEPCRSV